jgi:uncharacterized membrane protein YphA (DoxX/SURF4 family)
MRLIIGLALLVQGGYYVREPAASFAAWATGLTAFLAAALLLIGFLTPFAAGAMVLAGLGVWLSLLPACTPTLIDSRIPAVFALTILVAITALGPGALSLDARVFGRREIIFPPAPLRD